MSLIFGGQDFNFWKWMLGSIYIDIYSRKCGESFYWENKLGVNNCQWKETFREDLPCIFCKPRTLLSNMKGYKMKTTCPLENWNVFGRQKIKTKIQNTKHKTSVIWVWRKRKLVRFERIRDLHVPFGIEGGTKGLTGEEESVLRPPRLKQITLFRWHDWKGSCTVRGNGK